MTLAGLSLGKAPFVADSRDLLLSSYLDKPKLRAISADLAPRFPDWSMFPSGGNKPEPDFDPLYNNVAGCCTFSMGAHAQNLLRQHTGRTVPRVTWEMVRDAYARTGYDPVTGANDFGASIREDLLKPWKAEGLWGSKVVAYALVNHHDPDELALATWLGGGTLGGYQLPTASQVQADAKGRPQWEVPKGGWPAGGGPGTWGGHAIYTHGERGGNTWGQSVIWTPEWDLACCDERWLVLIDFWNVGGRAPNGFDWQQLLLDAEARAQV